MKLTFETTETEVAWLSENLRIPKEHHNFLLSVKEFDASAIPADKRQSALIIMARKYLDMPNDERAVFPKSHWANPLSVDVTPTEGQPS